MYKCIMYKFANIIFNVLINPEKCSSFLLPQDGSTSTLKIPKHYVALRLKK